MNKKAADAAYRRYMALLARMESGETTPDLPRLPRR